MLRLLGGRALRLPEKLSNTPERPRMQMPAEDHFGFDAAVGEPQCSDLGHAGEVVPSERGPVRAVAQPPDERGRQLVRLALAQGVQENLRGTLVVRALLVPPRRHL